MATDSGASAANDGKSHSIAIKSPKMAKVGDYEPVIKNWRCLRGFMVPVDGKTGERTTTFYQEGQAVVDEAEIVYLQSVQAPILQD